MIKGSPQLNQTNNVHCRITLHIIEKLRVLLSGGNITRFKIVSPNVICGITRKLRVLIYEFNNFVKSYSLLRSYHSTTELLYIAVCNIDESLYPDPEQKIIDSVLNVANSVERTILDTGYQLGIFVDNQFLSADEFNRIYMNNVRS